jgi:photosystem II stability/assembly factor-like uncharacterized protein
MSGAFIIVAAMTLALPLLSPSEARAWSPKYQTVDFISASRGWAAGLGSTIVRTTNGGKTWTVQKKASPTAPTINDICFYGKLRGWAVGYNARLYRTTNGGRTWRRITSPMFTPGDAFFAVKFVNASKGWMVGGTWYNSYLSTDVPTGVLYATTDGGRTWTHPWNASGGCWTALDMVNATTGVAVGRKRIQSDPSNGYDIPFFNATSDGWAGISGLGTPGATTVTSQVTDADMVAGGRIVLVGSYENGGGSFTPFLFSSPDGGVGWTESNPVSGPVMPQEVKMTSSLVGYCVGFGQQSVYKTIDGGANWSALTTRYGKSLMGCDFVSATTGYAVGATGTAHTPIIIKTTNGARTWARVK